MSMAAGDGYGWQRTVVSALVVIVAGMALLWGKGDASTNYVLLSGALGAGIIPPARAGTTNRPDER
jgi:hypothetical protein